MALPSPTIRVFFGTDFNETAFTLNDPVKGVLNDATYTLGGDTGTDITADGYAITIRRGRSRELDEFQAGTCNIEFRNWDHDYSPIWQSSPYFGLLIPGKRVTVELYGQTLFDGVTESWRAVDEPNGQLSATLNAYDALGQLARMEFDGFTATVDEVADQRLNTVLNRSEIAFPFNRDFEAGLSPLQADAVPDGTNVLNYCQLVALSDFGLFFASRNNVLTFQNRNHDILATAIDPAVDFNDDPLDWTDGTGVGGFNPTGPFRSYQGADSSERLINRVTVTVAGGTPQPVNDTTSQNTVGVRSKSVDGVLLKNDAAGKSMAEFLLALYKDPEHRLDSVDVDVSAIEAYGLNPAPFARVDIGEIIEVTIAGVNGPGVTNDYHIEGVEHMITPDEHVMTLQLTQFTRIGFILNSAMYGLLNISRLGF